ncbi:Uncharacterized protein SCF082_LOCUS12385 [Durusdinium trenchii]|uniref:Uncharacterized protein n=1 Tax=Durusdinium trenchii TaxID=1381693 RepID=A0ABP0JJJ6_9DINO
MASEARYVALGGSGKPQERSALIPPTDREPHRSPSWRGPLLAGLGLLALYLITVTCTSWHSHPGEAVATVNNAGCHGEIACPGSPAYVHASNKLVASTDASCADVEEEIKARAQGLNGWVDPHNKGTYTLLGEEAHGGHKVIMLQRLTGNKKYTDKIAMTLEKELTGGCKIKGCSESQVTSVGDFSTNLCNMFNLVCSSSSDPACKTVKHDFPISVAKVIPSIGASSDFTQCVVV